MRISEFLIRLLDKDHAVNPASGNTPKVLEKQGSYQRIVRPKPNTPHNEARVQKVAFRFAAIALGAKLAQVDGPVNSEEIEAFSNLFSIPDGVEVSMGKLFAEACADGIAPIHYARRITRFFPHNTAMREALLGNLVELAAADGPVTMEEIRYLDEIGEVFQLSRAIVLSRLRVALPVEGRPEVVLGMKKEEITPQTVKRRYRQALHLYHPDKLRSESLADDVRQIVGAHYEALTKAYHLLREEVGVR